jgi:hypothetical protein
VGLSGARIRGPLASINQAPSARTRSSRARS